MNSKGLLATFFTFLFLISLLSMSQHIKENKILIDDNRKYGLSLVKTTERFDQVLEGSLALMENVGKLSFSHDSNRARFSFSLPRTAEQALYEQRLSDFNQFVRKYPDTLDFNLNGGKFDLTTLSMWELDINFTQKMGPARDENAAFITPRIPDFNSYLVEIRLTGQDFTSLSSTVTNCSDCSSPIGLQVYVKDENGEVVDSFNNGNLDSFNYSEVIVETSSPGGADFNVSILPVGILSVRNDSNSVSDFNTQINFDTGQTELPFACLPSGLIEVHDTVLGARKK
jgi:hypothetical protein